jgi:PD-(D/E)XK nuclease superfamily protein
MTYSFTQISQYLSCPRRYRHRYLDGWREKDTRAAMLFGRAFEQALSAYFRREDSAAVLFGAWGLHKNSPLEYSNGTTWDRMLQQGIHLLDRFAQDDRVRVRQPRKNLQIKFTRPLPPGNDFVAYVDAIGRLDGVPCLLEWKTTSSRYLEEPAGLLMLDPQLVCYSWITGMSEVAQVVFVRKRLVEIQYFRTTITDEQRQEFRQLVEDTVRRIEAASSCHTAAFASPRTPASPARMSACAWADRN